jgi:4-hydroxyphenylacetate 3-monooxygenase
MLGEVFAGDAFARVKEIVEKIVAPSLIYLPSSVKDMQNPETEPHLRRFVRGSPASTSRSASRS